MNKWSVVCPEDGFRIEIMADSKEDAAKGAMTSSEFMNHLRQHPELANKPSDEAMTLILGMIQMES